MDFGYVSEDKILGYNDFHDIWDKLESLSPRWESVGLSLRLNLNTLLIIKSNYHGTDCERCLQEVITHWLKKDYNYQKYGNPSWRKVCIAVKKGGKDSALAEEIAREHLIANTNPSTVSPERDIASSSPVVPTSTDNSYPAMSPQSSGSNDRGCNTGPSAEPLLQLSPHYVSLHPPFDIANKLELSLQLQDLEDKFIEIYYETINAIPDHLLPKIVEYIEMHVASLLIPEQRTPANKQAMRDEFQHIQTTLQLHTVLEKYVSWFNYEFIFKLVQKFLANNCQLKRDWLTYTRNLDDYFNNNRCLLQDCVDDIEFGLLNIPNTQVMVAKVARNDYTMTELLFFYRAIPQALKVPKRQLYFCSINKGCLELNFLIPDYLISSIFPLTDKQLELLANIGITEIRCGGQTYSTFKTKVIEAATKQLQVTDFSSKPQPSPFFSKQSHNRLSLQELESEFIENYFETLISISSSHLLTIIEYLKTHMPAPLTPKGSRKPANMQAVQEEFQHIQTLPQLHTALKKYVSWFNYELIFKYVQKYLYDNRPLAILWTHYSEKFNNYFNNNHDSAIKCVGDIQFGNSNIPGTTVMVAKVSRNDYTMTDLLFFHRAIPQAFLAPNMYLHFCSIDKNCLKYLIPDYLISSIFPLTDAQLQLLANIGITEIRCRSQTKDVYRQTYSTKKPKKVIAASFSGMQYPKRGDSGYHQARSFNEPYSDYIDIPWCSGLKIVITGGCGFLGLHIARLLYKESSDVYITLMDIKSLSGDMMTFVTGETTSGARLHHYRGSVLTRCDLNNAFKGVDIVIHCATNSELKISSDINRKMEHMNIYGTANVVEACKLAGVKCLINIGTIFQAIYNGIPYQEGIHEDTPIRGKTELIMDALGNSKNIAENKVLEANNIRTGLYTCSIRTPPLYGENDTTLIPSAVYVANKFFGYYPRIGKKSVRMNVMYVENAAHAVVCAAKKLVEKDERVRGKYFYVTDDTKFTNYSDFFGHFLKPLGYSVNLSIRLPVKLVTFWLYMILMLLIFVMIFFDLQIQERVYLLLRYHHQAKILAVSHSFSRKKAKRVLGYEPIISFELASKKSLNYYFREYLYKKN